MNDRRRDGGRLALGLLLMVLGALLLADQLDLLHIRGVWNYWPLLLIGLGVARIVRPDDRDKDGRWGGVWLLMVGIYCGASTWHWFGLGWHNSWPLMIVAAGTMIVVRAITASRQAPPAHEMTERGAGDSAGTPDASGRTS
jgi:hypothetical protein